MDISAIMTALWSKISKPAPNIGIGIALLYFAPKDYQWFGYIFIAIGIGCVIEWCWYFLKTCIAKNLNDIEIKEKLSSLNEAEEKILRTMHSNNEQTALLSYEDFKDGRSEEFNKEYSTYNGLKAKGIIEISKGIGGIRNFTIPTNIWKVIDKVWGKSS